MMRLLEHWSALPELLRRGLIAPSRSWKHDCTRFDGFFDPVGSEFKTNRFLATKLKR
jgi:hypothetical protein